MCNSTFISSSIKPKQWLLANLLTLINLILHNLQLDILAIINLLKPNLILPHQYHLRDTRLLNLINPIPNTSKDLTQDPPEEVATQLTNRL